MHDSALPYPKRAAQHWPDKSTLRRVANTVGVTSLSRQVSVLAPTSVQAAATSRGLEWPRIVELLIGVIAGGVPEFVYFCWWTSGADNSVSMDDFRFALSAVEALVIGSAAGFICRNVWPTAGPTSVYRIFNTLVWACAGSFAGYFLAGSIIGVNTLASCVLTPFCQGAVMLPAMVYARCGGLEDDSKAPPAPIKRV
jgi:hypothetical protein